MVELLSAVASRAVRFVETLPDHPASPERAGPDAELLRRLLAPPSERPGDQAAILDLLDLAAANAVETAGPGYLAYVPGGGLFASAVADFYARATNRYVGLGMTAPGLCALEWGVIRWLCEVIGLPAGAGGVLVSGGSTATFAAIVAARERLGDDLRRGTMYLTPQAHHSVAKAAHLAGLPAKALRYVPTDADLRMDVGAARELIARDRSSGLRPFLLVGAAGTTNTGVVDPLADLAALARAEDLWLHVDAAYGGFFQLTERGRSRLAGIGEADSVVLDPHKSLFAPYGTGALLVRDLRALQHAHAAEGDYLQDLKAVDVPDFASLGPELTRESRGLRIWLPLQLHGVEAFRAALDEKLDLAEHAYARLAAEPRIETPWRPDLSIVGLRVRASTEAGADAAGRAVLERVNGLRRVFLSSTSVDGRFTLRLAIVSHRTHLDIVDEAVDEIVAAVRELPPS